MTPEGRVKQKVKKVLAAFSGLYAHWPVQNGMGSPTLDCIACYKGHYLAIETKAPGGKPTPRQELTIENMRSAGAVVFVIDSDEKIEQLESALKLLSWIGNADNSKS